MELYLQCKSAYNSELAPGRSAAGRHPTLGHALLLLLLLLSVRPFTRASPSTPPAVRLCAFSSPAHIQLCKSLLILPFFLPGDLSALSKVGEALGCYEGVGLQGEEVLLGQEEAGALSGVRRLVELQLGVS